jgi:hypothetical protein
VLSGRRRTVLHADSTETVLGAPTENTLELVQDWKSRTPPPASPTIYVIIAIIDSRPTASRTPSLQQIVWARYYLRKLIRFASSYCDGVCGHQPYLCRSPSLGRLSSQHVVSSPSHVRDTSKVIGRLTSLLYWAACRIHLESLDHISSRLSHSFPLPFINAYAHRLHSRGLLEGHNTEDLIY